jgi:hypothetical protein
MGKIVADGNQMNGPIDIIIDRERNLLIITEYGNRQVTRWSRQNKTNVEIIIADIDCHGLTNG